MLKNKHEMLLHNKTNQVITVLKVINYCIFFPHLYIDYYYFF